MILVEHRGDGVKVSMAGEAADVRHEIRAALAAYASIAVGDSGDLLAVAQVLARLSAEALDVVSEQGTEMRAAAVRWN